MNYDTDDESRNNVVMKNVENIEVKMEDGMINITSGRKKIIFFVIFAYKDSKYPSFNFCIRLIDHGGKSLNLITCLFIVYEYKILKK